MSKKVTVLMPVYNGGKYLAEAIESVLSQTFTDFEFLIVDDNSTDNTVDIVEKYKSKDSRIDLIHNKKEKGIVGALNTGIEQSHCEYVIRMDADDISMPQRFEKQVSYMDVNPNIGVSGTWMRTIGDSENNLWYAFPSDSDKMKIYLLFYTVVAHPTIIIRKKFLDKFDLRYDEKFNFVEDYELWTRAIDFFEFGNIKEVLLSYRVHSSTVTRTKGEVQRLLNRKVLKKQFLKLDLVPTDEEMDVHTKLYWGPYNLDNDFVECAERWLLKLIVANKKTRYYAHRKFVVELCKVFFRVCFKSKKNISTRRFLKFLMRSI